MQVSHDAYLPVDLIGGLFAEGGVRRPATGTDPLLLRNVMNFLDRLKGRVVPSAVPWTSGLLTSAAFLTRDIVFASSGLDRLAPLRPGDKDELAERRHFSCGCANLAVELARPYP